MNRPESNTAAAIVDFRVDKDANFKRTISILVEGLVPDLIYWEAEFVAWIPTTCKEIINWSLSGGELTIPVAGSVKWDHVMSYEKMVYDYHFKVVDENGDIKKYFKGKLIIE